MQTTISSKGRLVIPKDIRDALGIAAGALVDIELSGDAVVIKPHAMGNKTVNDVFGALSAYGSGSRITEEDIEAASLAAARVA